MKKNTFGVLSLIYGIIVSLIPVLRLFDLSVVGDKIITAFTLFGFIPGVVLGIIAIVKNSGKKQGIIGLIISLFSSFIGVVLRGIVQTLIK